MLQAATPDTAIAVLDAASTEQQTEGIERVMLADDRLPVAVAVVVVLWLGFLLLAFRTDRRLARIERQLDELDGAPNR